MKSFVASVTVAMALLVSCGVFCLEEPEKAIVKCTDEVITCACGKTGGNVTASIKMCPFKDRELGVSTCAPCDGFFAREDPCSRFKNCKACKNGVPKCTSCRTGQNAEFCDLGTVYMDKETLDFIQVKIPRGSTMHKKNRLARATEPCTLPDGMETNEIDCTIRPSSTTCTQKCVFGHEFAEGKERIIHCEHDKNVWEPSPVVEECDPIMNCHLVLTSAGETFCTSHMMEERTRCDIKCLEYGDEKEVAMETYECHGNGLWTPDLPFCVEVEEVEYH